MSIATWYTDTRPNADGSRFRASAMTCASRVYPLHSRLMPTLQASPELASTPEYVPAPATDIEPRPFSRPLSEWTFQALPERDPLRRSWSLTNPDDPEQVYYCYAIKRGKTWGKQYGRTAQVPEWADQQARPKATTVKDEMLYKAFQGHFDRDKRAELKAA